VEPAVGVGAVSEQEHHGSLPHDLQHLERREQGVVPCRSSQGLDFLEGMLQRDLVGSEPRAEAQVVGEGDEGGAILRRKLVEEVGGRAPEVVQGRALDAFAGVENEDDVERHLRYTDRVDLPQLSVIVELEVRGAEPGDGSSILSDEHVHLYRFGRHAENGTLLLLRRQRSEEDELESDHRITSARMRSRRGSNRSASPSS
jgi:hypothetical protein